jgi:hypothetical protein
MKLLPLVLCLAVSPTFGADMMLDINLASRHFNAQRDYNELNRGAGVTWVWDDPRRHYYDDISRGKLTLSAGTYLNSFYERSNYLGPAYIRRFGGRHYLDVGVFAPVVTGYEGVPALRVLPTVAYGFAGVGQISLFYGVKTSPDNSGVLMLSVKLNLEM